MPWNACLKSSRLVALARTTARGRSSRSSTLLHRGHSTPVAAPVLGPAAGVAGKVPRADTAVLAAELLATVRALAVVEVAEVPGAAVVVSAVDVARAAVEA